MTITVVIASYKYGHLAAHCIESILAQTKKADKIILVDDGVGDCNHLKNLYKDVEFIFRPNNLGTVKNFNEALQKVTTERCMFIGADNWLRPDALELLSEKTTDIVTYDILVTGELKQLRIDADATAKYSNVTGDLYWDRTDKHHGSMLYNTELAQQIGYRRHKTTKHSAEDLYLWDSMLQLGATVSHVPEGLLFYRQHRQNFNRY